MKNYKITKRIQYAIKIRLSSPLCIASGNSEETDKDVQRNAKGEVFIPGSSLAGAMRQYLEEYTDNNGLVETLFGQGYTKDGSMSRIQISDMYFTTPTEIIVRDGVALKNKVAIDGAKYDLQAIQTGTQGICFFMLTIRECDNEIRLEELIQNIVFGIMQDEIRLGANKNRGFGKLKIQTRKFESDSKHELEVYRKEFTKDNIVEWLDFTKEDWIKELEEEQIAKSSLWKVSFEKKEERYLTIRVPLKQKGGISIRTYSVVPGQPDYEYLNYNENAVIPGRSWAGAIRARVQELLKIFVKDELLIDSYIKTWFGFVEKNNACQSKVIFSESIIENGTALQMTRNSINRISGSSLEGGLYTEKSYFNGTLVLEMKVCKNYYISGINHKEANIGENATNIEFNHLIYEDSKKDVFLKKDSLQDYENLVGFLLLVAKDIQNGYLAVGGQTAIGRGVFEKNEKEIQLLGTNQTAEYFIGTLERLVKTS